MIKKHRRKKSTIQRKHARIPHQIIGYVIVTFGVVALAFTLRVINDTLKPRVLGTTHTIKIPRPAPASTSQESLPLIINNNGYKEINMKNLFIKNDEHGSQVIVGEPGNTLEVKNIDGKQEVKVTNPDGTTFSPQNLSSQILQQVTDELKSNNIELNPTPGNPTVINNGDMKVETQLPLQVDTDTKTISVESPDGTQTPTINAQDVVNKLIQDKVITQVNTQPAQGTDNQPANPIRLTTLDNHPVYEVPGIKQEKFCYILPLEIPTTAYVSASTGELIKTQQSLGSSILDALSF